MLQQEIPLDRRSGGAEADTAERKAEWQGKVTKTE